MDATTAALLDGLTDADGRPLVKSRDDGSVHTLHGYSDGATVAELCVGKSKSRLNFRAASPELDAAATAAGIVLAGRSKSWAGRGVNVDAGNVAACRAVLLAMVGVPAGEPNADATEPTPDDDAATEPTPDDDAATEPTPDAATEPTTRKRRRK